MYLIEHIIEYKKRNGIRCLLFVGFKFIVKLVFERKKEILSWHSTDAPRPKIEAKIPITIEKASIKDIPELSRLTVYRKPKEFRTWIEKGYIFTVAKIDGKIASYGCTCPASEYKGPMRRFIDLKEDDAWGLDCFTHPEFRGNKIYPAIASHNRKIIIARGFKRTVGSTGLNNEPAKKVHHISDSKNTKIINSLRILWFKKYWEERDGNGRL